MLSASVQCFSLLVYSTLLAMPKSYRQLEDARAS